MARSIAAIGLVLALIFSGSEKARAGLTIKDLYESCMDKEGGSPTMQTALCTGYISGVGDMMAKYGKLHAAGFSMCGSPSNGAMVQAFRNWAKEHPETWSDPQILGVATALTVTWPCPHNSPK